MRGRTSFWVWVAALSGGALVGCDSGSTPVVPGGAVTPAGYWEGKVATSETPMKDHARTLTRTVEGEMWFTVAWDKTRNLGTAAGEIDATYGAVLKVENLPKVTAPVPGGSVKFEPNVGGTLGADNRRKIRVVGVLSIDPSTNRGTLLLQKANPPQEGTASERLDAEAKGVTGPDAPMEFTIRADPGVSGGISGDAGNLNYSDGMLSGGSGGADLGADVGGDAHVIVQKIPMAPFSPFTDAPGKVEKRPGGPYVASFEEKTPKSSVVWTAKQVGGENREPLTLTPEMRAQIDALIERLRSHR
jgi:hypothetical protein